ncbi:cysteine hydrolase [Anoxybacillus geothermalis]|nr:cysteine hydrolase [Anoxybacillus geothermalis]
MREFEEKVHPTKTAVLVVDVQNDFCHPKGAFGLKGADLSMVKEMMPNLKRLLQSARNPMHRVPVIFIQTIHEPWTDSETWSFRIKGNSGNICRKDSWGSDFFKVAPQPDEAVVVKHRYSAFIHTRLDSVLRTLKIKTLVLTGVSTNVCVESTARDGFMLDYDIVFLEDCCAAYSRKAHEMTLENIQNYFGTVAHSSQVIECWENISRPIPSKAVK